MKKLKLISSLSILGSVGVVAPTILTSCSDYTGFIKSVDGSNLWVAQLNDIKVLMPISDNNTPVPNVTWSIKDKKSLEGKIDIKLGVETPNIKVPFARLYFIPGAELPTKEETITIHGENDDKSFKANSEIIIRPADTNTEYAIKVDGNKQTTTETSVSMKKSGEAGINLQIYDEKGSEINDKWKWQVDQVIDPSDCIAKKNNEKQIAFGLTTNGTATLKAVYTKQEGYAVAVCSAINSETKAELTQIIILDSSIQ